MGKPSFAADIDKIMENPNNGGVSNLTPKEWAKAMLEWGKAVRRDILVLEHHLKDKCGVDPNEFYGDPGDPPPPPPDFT